MNKTGKVSWKENTGGTKEGKEYMRWSEGANIIRLLTEPFQYQQHQKVFEGELDERKYGWKVNCSRTKENDECPVCAMGNTPQTKWLVGAIDRSTGQFKVCDISKSIYDGIKLLAEDSDWGDPINYDVSVIKNSRAKSPRDWYKILGKPKVVLSPSDILLKEENGEEYLAQRTTPPTPEQVQARLDKIREEIESKGGGPAKASSDSSDDDSEDFFKEYKAKTA